MLIEIRQRIASARAASAAAADTVTLIAVSKGQPLASIQEALEAGQGDFAENRVQEALEKWLPLRLVYPAAILHLIGPLQTNKAADAVALFDAIHTLDRPKLADALAAEMKKTGRRPACFIQVNTGEESQKSGIAPQHADDFIRYCLQLGLPITGLMCIPPAQEPPAPHFALLREIARRHRLAHLSMGMSNDFETAIRLGATHVRIGTAVFGERRAV